MRVRLPTTQSGIARRPKTTIIVPNMPKGKAAPSSWIHSCYIESASVSSEDILFPGSAYSNEVCPGEPDNGTKSAGHYEAVSTDGQVCFKKLTGRGLVDSYECRGVSG